MRRPILLSILVMVFFWTNGPSILGCHAAQFITEQVRERLRNRIEAAGTPPRITVGEELIYASVKLPQFYERRTYRPAWIGDGGPLPQVESLIKAIRKADEEGMKPGDYHLAEIERIVTEVHQNRKEKKPFQPGRLADLDLLLSDAFLVYGSHLLAGRVNPETFDREWHANRREADLADVLQNALVSNQIEASLRELFPPYPGYLRLRQALERYREIAAKGGWPMWCVKAPKCKRASVANGLQCFMHGLLLQEVFGYQRKVMETTSTMPWSKQ